jgi:hypothetical protein
MSPLTPRAQYEGMITPPMLRGAISAWQGSQTTCRWSTVFHQGKPSQVSHACCSGFHVACQPKVSGPGQWLSLMPVLPGRGAHPAAEDLGKMRLAGKADALGDRGNRQLRIR